MYVDIGLKVGSTNHISELFRITVFVFFAYQILNYEYSNDEHNLAINFFFFGCQLKSRVKDLQAKIRDKEEEVSTLQGDLLSTQQTISLLQQDLKTKV